MSYSGAECWVDEIRGQGGGQPRRCSGWGVSAAGSKSRALQRWVDVPTHEPVFLSPFRAGDMLFICVSARVIFLVVLGAQVGCVWRSS